MRCCTDACRLAGCWSTLQARLRRLCCSRHTGALAGRRVTPHTPRHTRPHSVSREGRAGHSHPAGRVAGQQGAVDTPQLATHIETNVNSHVQTGATISQYVQWTIATSVQLAGPSLMLNPEKLLENPPITFPDIHTTPGGGNDAPGR